MNSEEFSQNRPGWNEYFMIVAKIISSRSTCLSRPIGAVLVKNKHILATGYNGAMPDTSHCTDDGECFRRKMSVDDGGKYNYCRATHAEANAISQAARYGISINEAVAYTTLAPCYVCLKLLATANIKKVYYEYSYESVDKKRDSFWEDSMSKAGIEVEELRVSEESLEEVFKSMKYPTSARRLKSS